MRSLVVVAALAVTLLASVAFSITTPQGSMHDCAVQAACRPWAFAHHACKRKARMDLRFTMDQAHSRWVKEVNGSEGLTADRVPGIPYFFCPVVDELQAFGLNHSAAYALLRAGSTDEVVAPWDISDMWSTSGYNVIDPQRKWLNVSVFGMGPPNPNGESPDPSDDSSALVVENNSTMCPPLTIIGTNNSFSQDLTNTRQSAMVQFLVLNITLTNGEFKYQSGFNQPIQSGFAPTCDETDKCALFDGGVCIGLKKGKKNCAKCVANPNSIVDTNENIDLKIWASYYGTDSAGRKLMSGSENPLSFTQFSAEPVFEKVGGELGNIERKF